MAVRSCNSEVLGLYCAGWVIDQILCWVQSLLDPVCWPDCICGHLLRGVFMIEKGNLGNGSCFIIQPRDNLFLVTCDFFLTVCVSYYTMKTRTTCMKLITWYLIAIGLCKLELYSLSLLFPKHSGASAWAFPWILGSISGGESICNDIHSWNHQLHDLSLLKLLERSSSSPISILKNTTVGSFSTFHLSDNLTSHLENYRDIFLPLSSFYNSSLGVWVYVGSRLCLARDYLP